MKQRSRFIWAVILSLVGFFCLTMARSEPKPGRHSWLLGLAGDPSVVIDHTPFEIGPSTGSSRTFTIRKWEMIKGTDFAGEVQKSILEHVLEYSTNGHMIAVITTEGKALINVVTEEVIHVDEVDEKKAMLPEASALLFASAKPPVMSNKTPLTCGGVASLLGSLIIMARHLVSRNKSSRAMPPG